MQENNQQPVLPEHIDGSYFTDMTNGEFVGQGLLDAEVMRAESLLRRDGVASTVNDMDAVVSAHYAKIDVAGQTYYGRIYKELAADSLPAYVLDMTEEVTVVTNNPYALRFLRMGGPVWLQSDTDNEQKAVNDPDALKMVRSIEDAISKAVHDAEQAAVQSKAAQQQAETERRKQLRQERENQRITKRNHRQQAIERAKRNTAETAPGVIVGLGITAVVAGFITTIVLFNGGPSDEESFDAHKYAIPEKPVVLTLGESAVSPAFAQSVLFNKALARDQVPIVDENYGKYDTTGSLKPNGQLREITITSSKTQHNMNCTSFTIPRTGPNEKIATWTDFADQNGKSRAGELKVSFTIDTGTACWYGQERSADDDPRILVAMEPTAAH